MDRKTFKTVLAALILYDLVSSGTLLTIGGTILALIVMATVFYEPKPKSKRIPGPYKSEY